MPASLRASAWRQAIAAPITSRPRALKRRSACQAATSGCEQRRLAGAGDAGQQGERAALAERVDGRPLLGRERACPVRCDRMPAAPAWRAPPSGPGRSPAPGRRQLLLDADLRGVGDPHHVVEHADHQGDVLAPQPDAALLEQLDDPLDVVRAAGDAGADQAARRIQAELLVGDDGGGVELLGQVPGRERVGPVEALRRRSALVVATLP